MAGPAENECFAFACGHRLHPSRFLSACVLLQVFEIADVMDLDVVCGTAMFTFPCQQAFFEF